MNRALLLRLQQGLPLAPRPFEALGRELGVPESTVLGTVQRLLEAGTARRLGAVFDARRLGYRSVLCAMAPGAAALEPTAATVSRHSGVTHCYERGWPADLPSRLHGAPAGADFPNLWFTFAAPAERFAGQFEDLERALEPHAIHPLPAVRRFKVEVIFDLRERPPREELPPLPAFAHRPRPAAESEAALPFSARDREIVRALAGALPAEPAPFATVAQQAGMAEEELLALLADWQRRGVLRRVALVLRHQRCGFTANGMCVWDVSAGTILRAGRRLARHPAVTHCYERTRCTAFPGNLYAMIHTGSWPATHALFTRLGAEADVPGGRLLCSLREFKKTSLPYFEP